MAEQGAAIRDVGLSELKDGLADGSIVLVDVREPNETALGIIPGAVVMPLSEFDPARLPQGQGRIVFSCRSGVRSIRAIELARAAGLPVSEHFAPGFNGWVAAGETVARD
ncbi:MAG: sulfurtransferase [Methylobacteriaceae bacterium]|nr:sulfurtransferase [Methylobacteriaceae bacterium]